MSSPTQTCEICGVLVVVTFDGRGFPPNIAARKLTKICAAAGHASVPRYRAGLGGGLLGHLSDPPAPKPNLSSSPE